VHEPRTSRRPWAAGAGVLAVLSLGAGLVAGLAGLGIVGVAVIRLSTDLAIPGWATTAVGDLLIVLLQILVIVIAASLTVLAGRSNRPIVPIVDCPCFVAERRNCRLDRRRAAVAAVRPAA